MSTFLSTKGIQCRVLATVYISLISSTWFTSCHQNSGDSAPWCCFHHRGRLQLQSVGCASKTLPACEYSHNRPEYPGSWFMYIAILWIPTKLPPTPTLDSQTTSLCSCTQPTDKDSSRLLLWVNKSSFAPQILRALCTTVYSHRLEYVSSCSHIENSPVNIEEYAECLTTYISTSTGTGTHHTGQKISKQRPCMNSQVRHAVCLLSCI